MITGSEQNKIPVGRFPPGVTINRLDKLLRAYSASLKHLEKGVHLNSFNGRHRSLPTITDIVRRTATSCQSPIIIASTIPLPIAKLLSGHLATLAVSTGRDSILRRFRHQRHFRHTGLHRTNPHRFASVRLTRSVTERMTRRTCPE
jgi:hypothetical protein